jgi:hypothetical protein
MTGGEVGVETLPANVRAAFADLVQLLSDLAGDNLLGLTAFGGWLVDDPLYRGAPASSVAVLKQFDLYFLDRLARQGTRLGKRGLRAPLIMTPDYIRASCDTFPLELLEIQQVGTLLCGVDYFADLHFERVHVRLQCERELKSQLIHLRQGLLAAAGHRKRLAIVCGRVAERSTRVLRGVLHLAGADLPRQSANLAERSAELTGIPLDALRQVMTDPRKVEFAAFERFYQEVSALADYVDKLSA